MIMQPVINGTRNDVNGSELRQGWVLAARFYWAQAFLAKKSKDFRLMRTCATQARDAERQSGIDGVLMATIVGGYKAAPESLVSQGASISAELAQQAKVAVIAEEKTHAKRQEDARSAKLPAAKPIAAASNPSRQAVIDWLADNGGTASKEALMAAGHSNITIMSMVRDNQLKALRGDKFSV